MAIIDNISVEELKNIVLNSNSYKEVIQKVGYQTVSGSNIKTVKSRLEKYNISTEHFTNTTHPTERNIENIFCENSTATQATLRRWYLKDEYSEYKCSICGQLPEWNGKPLTLILDHIDGNNSNHQLFNLRWVCPNCNQQLETTGFKKMRTKEKKQLKNTCIDCGVEISKSATRCLNCSNKFKTNDLPISRNDLKDKIRIQSFSSIGQEFKMSDNAIRKWCIKYNLPSTKREINSYSEEEWINI